MDNLLNNGMEQFHNIKSDLRWRKQIKDICKLAEVRIKKLSREQEREIQSYYTRFGFKAVRLDWHKYIYSVTGVFYPKVIPEDFFHRVLENEYNQRSLYRAWENKAYMPRVLPGVKFPDTIVCNCNGYYYDKNYAMISEEKAKALVMECGSSFAKPTMASGGGKGCVLLGDGDPGVAFDQLNKDFIVQRRIVQSQETAKYNPSSVNTIKVVSMLFKGEVHILSSIMRVGAENSITDAAASGKGYFFGIDKEGIASSVGINIFGRRREKDYYGNSIKGQAVPCFREICEIVKECHNGFPFFGIMSWDFCINDKNEVILIEYNVGYPVAMVYQMVNGPLLGELSDMVLKDAASKTKR